MNIAVQLSSTCNSVIKTNKKKTCCHLFVFVQEMRKLLCSYLTSSHHEHKDPVVGRGSGVTRMEKSQAM